MLLLGDIQYQDGRLGAFRQSYDVSWGRYKDITYPSPGNHEYETPGAAGYFAYFGSRAGNADRGYYAFDVGTWRLIALNSNCWAVGGCHAGSAQERWLRAELAANPARCTLAYWHHARFSSGRHGSNDDYDAFWDALYGAGADLVLVGHDHHYERFAPQSPEGVRDDDRGIRQFVVGTGGRSSYLAPKPLLTTEVKRAGVFGVLFLTLRSGGYDFEFAAEPVSSFTDAGSGKCR